MRSPKYALAAVTGVALAGAALAGCGGGEDRAPARPVPAAIEVSSSLPRITLGVIVSAGSAPGEGAEWKGAAEGAQVAAYRLGRSGIDVRLRAVDDRGTAEGAAAAVEQLAEAGASGIVVATSGMHLDGVLEAAEQAEMPLVLPYDGRSDRLHARAWSVTASHEQVGDVLSGVLEQRDLSRVAVVDAGETGQEGPEGLDPVVELAFPADGTGQRPARRIARLVEAGRVDSVVVTGPAALQARVVAAIQQTDAGVPVLLTPDALSQSFAAGLVESGGSLSGDLVTAGLDTDDPAALAPGGRGPALSAWLAGLRIAAADGSVSGHLGDQSFAEAAGSADTRSHDAVVALAHAAARAESTDPAAVASALAELRLDTSDGLAGPELDFGSPTAVSSEAVVPLQATAQDPELRGPVSRPTARLFWFSLDEG